MIGVKRIIFRVLCGLFLSIRSFQVQTKNILSEKHTLECGIPQGSTINVMVFIIAIKDLDPEVEATLYVDDLAIYFSATSMTEIENKLQTAINHFSTQADLTMTYGLYYTTVQNVWVLYLTSASRRNHTSMSCM